MFFAINFLILFELINLTLQDVYLHNPRGSNNRLNEKSAARTNGNRLFDSQNNNRGGYNVGDVTNAAFTTENGQYQMRYFQSGLNGPSKLKIEWTEQHGCGGNDDDPLKTNCAVVLQYMCQDVISDQADLDRLRDGLNTNQQQYTEMNADDKNSSLQRKITNVDVNVGLQEPWEWYDSCRYRDRNKNLFTADQNLKNNNKGYSSAAFTRQNANGNRNGYECPEERDYYPYWHPTVWKDIAILTTNPELCNTMYSPQSFNVQPYYECVQFYPDSTRKHWSRYNNENDCKNNSGVWTAFYNYLEKAPQFQSKSACESQSNSKFTYKWALPYGTQNINQPECLVLLQSPVCQQSSLSRSNHLGNTDSGETPNFNWQLPYFPSKKPKRCVFRIRYNITTNDYDPFQTNSSFNGINSPVKTNPSVSVGAPIQTLTLAINTAQYGRVFQDRSHVFYLLPRSNLINDNSVIYNLNVRGKRGNIVQTYPATEYDFVPNNLQINKGDLIHLQWAGSNTHNNGNPAGDGQAGDDGQGNTGTDRNNFVEVSDLNQNYPLPFENTKVWNDMQVLGVVNQNFTDTDSSSYFVGGTFNSKDLALLFSTSGYYQCASKTTCTQSFDSITTVIDANLNQAPASVAGAIFTFKNSNRVYNFICSRNNNFSNRSQKGSITVN